VKEAAMSSRLHRAFIVAALFGTAAPILRAQPCQPYWARGFPLGGSPNYIGSASNTLIEFDDGSGPALFGLWMFDPRVFRWRDGAASWELVESGMPQGYRYATNLFVLDNGSGPSLCTSIGIYVGVPTLAVKVMRWTGSGWEEPWPGLESGAYLVSGDIGDGPSIYGVIAPTRTTRAIARWAGDHWQTLGPTIGDFLMRPMIMTTAAGTRLYARAEYPTTPNGFALWNGQQWVPVGDADHAYVLVAGSFDDGSGSAAYGSGGFNRNGTYYDGLIRFNGQHWETLGQPGPRTSFYTHRGTLLVNDGQGPAAYVWGSFSTFGDLSVHNIARYDLLNHTWSAVGDGLGGDTPNLVYMPSRRGPSLFARGSFTTAGGGIVDHSAQLVLCPNCYANCDQSTRAPTLNVNDFLCFMSSFAVSAPGANCTNDAAIDIADFVCFVGRFAAGCP
jgi:hypothetical protein